MAHDSSKDPGYSDFMSDAGMGYVPPAKTPQPAYDDSIIGGPSITGKSQKILDLEKKLGITINAYYNTVGGGGSKADSRQVGAPTSYSYDNGQGQLVYLDQNGDYVNTVKPQSLLEQALPVLGMAAGAYFLAPVVNSLFGSGAAAGELATTAALPLSEVGAASTPLTSLNEMVASGTFTPGSAASLNAPTLAANPAALSAANGIAPVANTLSNLASLAPTATPGTPPPPDLGPPALPPTPTPIAPSIPSGPPSTPGTPPPPDVGPPGTNIPPATPTLPPTATPGTPPPPDVGPPGTNIPLVTPSLDPSLLQKLKDVTGLNGTQLAALLSGGVNAASAANISSAIGAGLKGQQEATKASQDVLKGVYNQQLGFQQPYQGAGVNAINQLGQLGSGQYQQYDPVTGQPTTTGAGSGYLTHQFNAADLAGGLAPNYDFMLQQGQMANQRAANVGGGALSGNTLQGLQKYTQDYAGNAYQNAFQNYQTQRNNIYNNLSNMAGIGQTANQQAGTAGQAYGTGITGLNTGLANATAAAMLGQAQAAGGGANAAANATFLAALLGQK